MKHTSQRTIALTVAALATAVSGMTATAAVAAPAPPGPQVEHRESQPMELGAIPSKAAIEHREALKTAPLEPSAIPSKAAIEHREALARAGQPSEAVIRHWTATPPQQVGGHVRSAHPVHTSPAPQPVVDDGTDWVPDVKAMAGVGLGLLLMAGIAMLVRQLRQGGRGPVQGTA